MRKPTKLQKRLWTVLVFLGKFMLFAIPLHVLLWLNIDTTPFQELTASHTNSILLSLGQDVRQEGIFIHTGSIIFQFVRDCTAWKSMLAFGALVFASPFVTVRSRGLALLWGLPAIYLINLVRTSSTIYVGIHNPAALEVVHTFLWREGLILVIVAMWYLWYRYSKDMSLADYGGLEKMVSLFRKV